MYQEDLIVLDTGFSNAKFNRLSLILAQHSIEIRKAFSIKELQIVVEIRD